MVLQDILRTFAWIARRVPLTESQELSRTPSPLSRRSDLEVGLESRPGVFPGLRFEPPGPGKRKSLFYFKSSVLICGFKKSRYSPQTATSDRAKRLE